MKLRPQLLPSRSGRAWGLDHRPICRTSAAPDCLGQPVHQASDLEKTPIFYGLNGVMRLARRSLGRSCRQQHIARPDYLISAFEHGDFLRRRRIAFCLRLNHDQMRSSIPYLTFINASTPILIAVKRCPGVDPPYLERPRLIRIAELLQGIPAPPAYSGTRASGFCMLLSCCQFEQNSTFPRRVSYEEPVR